MGLAGANVALTAIRVFGVPFLIEWYVDIFLSTYGYDSTYNHVIQQFNIYLKRLVNNAKFDAFSNAIITLGIVLILYHFFADLTEKAAEKQLSPLIMGKSFCILFLSIFTIFHTKEIFIFMMKFVDSIYSSVLIDTPGSKLAADFFSSDVTQILLSNCVSEYFSIWSIMGYTLTAIILMIMNLITKAYLMYYSSTRILQLFVYFIYAPIGVSDMFENGPGASININSSGFRYLKTMFAMMLQIVVIAVIMQTFPLISSGIQKNYYTVNGGTMEGVTGLTPERIAEMEEGAAPTNPIWKFKFTDHKADVFEWFATLGGKIGDATEKGVNTIEYSLKAMSGTLGGDDELTADMEQKHDPAEEDEKYPINRLFTYHDIDNDKLSDFVPKTEDIITNDDDEKYAEIVEDIRNHEGNYRMTIESTEYFFNYCAGADGSKIILFIILMATKMMLIMASGKISGSIVGAPI